MLALSFLASPQRCDRRTEATLLPPFSSVAHRAEGETFQSARSWQCPLSRPLVAGTWKGGRAGQRRTSSRAWPLSAASADAPRSRPRNRRSGSLRTRDAPAAGCAARATAAACGAAACHAWLALLTAGRGGPSPRTLRTWGRVPEGSRVPLPAPGLEGDRPASFGSGDSLTPFTNVLVDLQAICNALMFQITLQNFLVVLSVSACLCYGMIRPARCSYLPVQNKVGFRSEVTRDGRNGGRDRSLCGLPLEGPQHASLPPRKGPTKASSRVVSPGLGAKRPRRGGQTEMATPPRWHTGQSAVPFPAACGALLAVSASGDGGLGCRALKQHLGPASPRRQEKVSHLGAAGAWWPCPPCSPGEGTGAWRLLPACGRCGWSSWTLLLPGPHLRTGPGTRLSERLCATCCPAPAAPPGRPCGAPPHPPAAHGLECSRGFRDGLLGQIHAKISPRPRHFSPTPCGWGYEHCGHRAENVSQCPRCPAEQTPEPPTIEALVSARERTAPDAGCWRPVDTQRGPSTVGGSRQHSAPTHSSGLVRRAHRCGGLVFSSCQVFSAVPPKVSGERMSCLLRWNQVFEPRGCLSFTRKNR